MGQLVLNKFTRAIRNLSDNVVPGNININVPNSFQISKIVNENVEVHKKLPSGELAYQAYEDANGALHPFFSVGWTAREVNAGEVNFDIRFQPVVNLVTQNVEINGITRLQDFELPELLQAKALAYLVDNPNYDNILLENFSDASGIWDNSNSDNYISESFRTVLHKSGAIRSLAITLPSAATNILPIFNIDDGIDVEISADGATSFDTVFHNVPALLSVPGTSMVLRFTNTSSTVRKTIRSFAILYK